MGPEQEATLRGWGDPSGMPDSDRQCAGSRGLLEGALGPWGPLPNALSQAAAWLLCTTAGKKLLSLLPAASARVHPAKHRSTQELEPLADAAVRSDLTHWTRRAWPSPGAR